MICLASHEASPDSGALGVALITKHHPTAHQIVVLEFSHTRMIGDLPLSLVEVIEFLFDRWQYVVGTVC